MWKRHTIVALAVLAAGLLAGPAAQAAPVPVAASLQWRGHLPELGTRPSVRLFQTVPQYESFRSGLSDPGLFPPANRLFMSFDRDVLVLYARGEDAGGRCLRTSSTGTLDGDSVTLELGWEAGTCGAPATARHPFAMVSLSRTAADGTAWVQPSRSVCGAPPGVDRVCASAGGGTAASPSPATAASPSPTAAPSPSPAASSPTPAAASPSPTASRTPAPSASPTPVPTAAAPTVALASPTRSPDPTPRPVDVPTDDTVNYMLWGALGLIVLFVIVAGLFARSPRR